MKGFFVLSSLWAYASAINCDGIEAFQASKTYPRGATVIHSGQVYTASVATLPTTTPQGSPVWIPIGGCAAGAPAVRGVGVSGDLDCSDAFPYVAKIYKDPNMKVYFDGSRYHTNYYAAADDSPATAAGEGKPWTLDGKCVAGTMGEGPVVYVDCSGVKAWSGAITYATERTGIVHSNGNEFVNKYWTQGDKPDENNGDGPWEYEGRCVFGTDSEGAPPNPNEVTEEKAKLLCNCCTGCAGLNNLGPQCLDKVTSEDTCYFTWCPSVGTPYNAETCQYIKDTHQLHYYTGEMPEGQKDWPAHVFAPYIDGGLAAQPPIDELVDTLGLKYFVLAFAQTGAFQTTVGCQAALASAIPVKEGPTSWNSTKQDNDMFYERVAELRKKGGDICFSFGGYNGIELADHRFCNMDANNVTLPEDQIIQNLIKAYKEPIDFLKLTHVDFDIEGNAYDSRNRQTGWVWRFKAIKAIKAEYPDLKVWWTLPILPQGLTDDGYNFVFDLFASGITVDRLNMMTMDYGDSTVCPGDDMHACEIMAMDALAKQVFDIATKTNTLSQYGWTSPDQIYPLLGSTPMIGQNDIVTEQYSLQNAKDSMNVWKTTNRKLGMLSMWSLTRDHPCDFDYTDCLCSSKNHQKEEYEYSKIYAEWTNYAA